MNSSRASVLGLLLLLLPAMPARADLRPSGYLKTFLGTLFLPPELRLAGSSPLAAFSSTRLRLQCKERLAPHLSLHAATDLTLKFQNRSLFAQELFAAPVGAQRYRAWDFDPLLLPTNPKNVRQVGLYGNLDRLSLNWATPLGDLTVGRQSIAWGSGRLLSPTDVLAPFAFNTWDTEDRRGVDALRLQIPLGALSGLDLGLVAGHNKFWNEGARYVRGRFRLGRMDTEILVMDLRQNLLLGLNLTGSLGGAGAWLDLAWVDEGFWDRTKTGATASYARLSCGLDTRFSDQLYGFVELHANTAGAGRASDYPQRLNEAAWQGGDIYLLGRFYLGGGLTWTPTPLLSLTLSILANPADASGMLAPQAELNLAENLYLSLGAYLFPGRGFDPDTRQARSEFGPWPHMAFAALRFYF